MIQQVMLNAHKNITETKESYIQKLLLQKNKRESGEGGRGKGEGNKYVKSSNRMGSHIPI